MRRLLMLKVWINLGKKGANVFPHHVLWCLQLHFNYIVFSTVCSSISYTQNKKYTRCMGETINNSILRIPHMGGSMNDRAGRSQWRTSTISWKKETSRSRPSDSMSCVWKNILFHDLMTPLHVSMSYEIFIVFYMVNSSPARSNSSWNRGTDFFFCECDNLSLSLFVKPWKSAAFWSRKIMTFQRSLVIHVKFARVPSRQQQQRAITQAKKKTQKKKREWARVKELLKFRRERKRSEK